MTLRSASILLLVGVATASVAAQTEPPPEADIVVVVIGRGLAARPGDKAFDVVTIDAARIAENASNRLESVLADVAGLQQFRDDQNTRRLAPATTLDGYLALPVTRWAALELRAENLFDERVEAGISGADVVERATPRTLWLGLRLRGG